MTLEKKFRHLYETLEETLPGLTEYQKTDIAVRLLQAEIIAGAFMVDISGNMHSPVALEGIAIALGMKPVIHSR